MTHPHTPTPTLSQGMVRLFAFCAGAIVGNIYYAQPIIALIAPDLGLPVGQASLIVSLTQVGYALAMFFLVPLCDLLENRRLMVVSTLGAALSLLGAALCHQPGPFLLASLLVGVTSVAVQILIPLAAHLTPEARRGRVVGSIMSGLLLGILLARPVASFVADHLGWRAVFLGAAALMLLVGALLWWVMPVYRPQHKASYPALLVSLGSLFRRLPELRRRAFLQAALFATFSLFWTAVPMQLMQRYGLSQSQIALFALVGALGTAAAPLAGRLADAGHTRRATYVALGLAGLSFLPSLLETAHGYIWLALTGVVLDCAVQMNMVLGQRTIYGLDAASRGRINALYMTNIFLGGSIGSGLASGLFGQHGWHAVALLGLAVPLLALLGFAWSNRPGAALAESH
ncbi:MAG: putative transporter [Pseudomonas citronellolis]|nr:MAG: putative transporter [Pseudomonas citronellolis]